MELGTPARWNTSVQRREIHMIWCRRRCIPVITQWTYMFTSTTRIKRMESGPKTDPRPKHIYFSLTLTELQIYQSIFIEIRPFASLRLRLIKSSRRQTLHFCGSTFDFLYEQHIALIVCARYQDGWANYIVFNLNKKEAKNYFRE